MNAVLAVTRTGGDVGAISVDYATVDDTAVTIEADNTNGLRDYEPTIGTLNWNDFEVTSKNITVPVNEDLIIDTLLELLVEIANSLAIDQFRHAIVDARVHKKECSFAIGKLHPLEEPAELPARSEKQLLPFHHCRINMTQGEAGRGAVRLPPPGGRGIRPG